MSKIYCRIRTEEQLACVSKERFIDVFICPPKLYPSAAGQICGDGRPLYLELPAVLREKRKSGITDLVRNAGMADVTGILVQNFDEVGLLKETGYQGDILAGELLYSYNSESIRFIRQLFDSVRFLAPCELTLKELHALKENTGESLIFKLYGQQLLMVTAQCLVKDHSGCCRKELPGTEIPHLVFTNQKKDSFYAVADCQSCCNLIYSKEPVSMTDCPEEFPGNDLLLDFTIESRIQTEAVLQAAKNKQKLTCAYSRGHYYKGIE